MAWVPHLAVVVIVAMLAGWPSTATAQPLVEWTAALATNGAPTVPLTSGNGVYVADVPLTLHAEGTTLFVTRWEPSPAKIEVARFASGMTIAGRELSVLVVYVDHASSTVRAMTSSDGGRSWGASQALGTRPAGPAILSACVFSRSGVIRQVVVWTNQPSESDGPLVVAWNDGSQWRTTEHPALRVSGASLACSDDALPEVVWRDHRDGATPTAVSLYHAQIDDTGGLPGEHRVLRPAFDPSVCRSSDRMRVIGYHAALNDAHVALSTDAGVTFTDLDMSPESGQQPLDVDGKYVNVACRDDAIVALWGDWPTKGAAAARADTRQLGVVVSTDRGATWTRLRPAGEDSGQGPASVALAGDVAIVSWRAPSSLRIAQLRLR